jgi:hypothetical protein
MRDIERMARTRHSIRKSGRGLARRIETSPHGFIWFAGNSMLNGQAVSDLIANGWLFNPAGTDHTHILAWPRFAGEVDAFEESGNG